MTTKSETRQVEETKCPFCRRILLLDNEHEETWHEQPVCASWMRYCEKSGAQPLGERMGRLLPVKDGSPPQAGS